MAENAKLREKLAHAEKWMQRQIVESVRSLALERSKKGISAKISDMYASETIDMIMHQIQTYFSDALENAPPFTLERLIDSEIYWQTLQLHSRMDAFPIVASYQKILDAHLEHAGTKRIRARWAQMTHHLEPTDSLDHDCIRVGTKEYTLSIGRWYQLIGQSSRGVLTPVTESFVALLEESAPLFWKRLTSVEGGILFDTMMELEVFSRKRHESKVSYRDAQEIRKILTGEYRDSAGFLFLFQMPY